MGELARFGRNSPIVIGCVRAFASGQLVADFEPTGPDVNEVGRLSEFRCRD